MLDCFIGNLLMGRAEFSLAAFCDVCIICNCIVSLILHVLCELCSLVCIILSCAIIMLFFIPWLVIIFLFLFHSWQPFRSCVHDPCIVMKTQLNSVSPRMCLHEIKFYAIFPNLLLQAHFLKNNGIIEEYLVRGCIFYPCLWVVLFMLLCLM